MTKARQLSKLLGGSVPSALDTLNEIATALGNDASLATTLTNAIALKANSSDMTTALAGKQASIGYTPVNKAGDTMTGNLTAPSLISGNYSLDSGGVKLSGSNVVRSYVQNGIRVDVDSTDKHRAIMGRGISFGGYPSCEIKKAFWRIVRFSMPNTSWTIRIRGNHRGMHGTDGYHEEYVIEGKNDSDQVGFKIKNETWSSSLIQILKADKTGYMPSPGANGLLVLKDINSTPRYENVDLCLAITPACGSTRDYYVEIEWYGDSNLTMLNYLDYGPNYDAALTNGPNILGRTD